MQIQYFLFIEQMQYSRFRKQYSMFIRKIFSVPENIILDLESQVIDSRFGNIISMEKITKAIKYIEIYK